MPLKHLCRIGQLESGQVVDDLVRRHKILQRDFLGKLSRLVGSH